jgi:pyruvate formate lyase activating enzyme
MRCDYCYNRDIVFAKNGTLSLEEALDFLKTRVSLLDAVVLSGGEATEYDLTEFCQAIKELGFLIKLDTNGTNYPSIKKLIDLQLLDYVALDYKAPKNKFTQITHSHRYDEFSASLDLLIEQDIPFEARTTLHADLLNVDDINNIIGDLKYRGYNSNYYIQNFQETQNNIGGLVKASASFDKSRLKNDLKIIWR